MSTISADVGVRIGSPDVYATAPPNMPAANADLQTKISTYLCPSDRGGPAYWMGDAYYRARGNYAVNYGNVRDPINTTTVPAACALRDASLVDDPHA